ncbi:hypothetical protein [Streptomyces enissocaesilis]|uniref:Peptidase inhibitor family I36 n=1 Tax=Streptomyces enissocaesilis TaxID=332589 RepID=A0ABN3WP60_9ACTN
MSAKRTFSVISAGAFAAAALTITGATPAAADTCMSAADKGGYEIYYNSNQDSAWQGFAWNDANHYDDYFMCKGNGNGYTQVVKNNAAYVVNWNNSSGVRIYYNSNYQGASQTFGKVFSSTYAGPLNSTLKNNNASSHYV